MAVPQRKVGSAKAGHDAGADAQADAARPKGMILSVMGSTTAMEKARGCSGCTALTGKSCEGS